MVNVKRACEGSFLPRGQFEVIKKAYKEGQLQLKSDDNRQGALVIHGAEGLADIARQIVRKQQEFARELLNRIPQEHKQKLMSLAGFQVDSRKRTRLAIQDTTTGELQSAVICPTGASIASAWIPCSAVHAKVSFGCRAGIAGCAIASWWIGVAVVLLSLPSKTWSVLWKMAS